MRLSTLSVLSDEDIRAIHGASLDILERTGVKILEPAMFTLLKEAGLPGDENTAVVRMPRARVEAALATVPPHFEVFDREGKFAFVLGDGAPKIAAGHNAVFWVDSKTGETRPSTIADVEQFARLCEALPNIDMIGIPVMPQDVPVPKATLLYGVKACIENSRKPIFFSTDNAPVNHAVMEMLRGAFNGDMREQAYGISQLSPTSPLFWEESVCTALRGTVEAGVPLAILPEPIAGFSAPYTLAGLLTVNNAECLSGIVMTQVIKPGAKVLYANSWTTVDMRTGFALVGSVETSICRIAGAQLARFYQVPSHTTAPNSDNHVHDEQNAWEKTLSMVCALAAGNDLVVNCGMFATGMTCSHEQLLMDEEISAMARRLASGIEVNETMIAKDLVQEIGPRGSGYMESMHTLEWLRSNEHFLPRLAVRGPFATWKAQGGKDTYQMAREAVREMAVSAGVPLEASRRATVDAILQQFTVKEKMG